MYGSFTNYGQPQMYNQYNQNPFMENVFSEINKRIVAAVQQGFYNQAIGQSILQVCVNNINDITNAFAQNSDMYGNIQPQMVEHLCSIAISKAWEQVQQEYMRFNASQNQRQMFNNPSVPFGQVGNQPMKSPTPYNTPESRKQVEQYVQQVANAAASLPMHCQSSDVATNMFNINSINSIKELPMTSVDVEDTAQKHNEQNVTDDHYKENIKILEDNFIQIVQIMQYYLEENGNKINIRIPELHYRITVRDKQDMIDDLIKYTFPILNTTTSLNQFCYIIKYKELVTLPIPHTLFKEIYDKFVLHTLEDKRVVKLTDWYELIYDSGLPFKYIEIFEKLFIKEMAHITTMYLRKGKQALKPFTNFNGIKCLFTDNPKLKALQYTNGNDENYKTMLFNSVYKMLGSLFYTDGLLDPDNEDDLRLISNADGVTSRCDSFIHTCKTIDAGIAKYSDDQLGPKEYETLIKGIKEYSVIQKKKTLIYTSFDISEIGTKGNDNVLCRSTNKCYLDLILGTSLIQCMNNDFDVMCVNSNKSYSVGYDILKNLTFLQK